MARIPAIRVAALTALLLALTSVAAARDLRLITAVKNQDAASVGALLTAGVDVNAAQGDGGTALHWAAYRDDLAAATALVRAGAKVNVANDLGVTPLYLAASSGSAAMMKALLDAGADPNLVPPTAVSPLMLAARAGSAEGVQALLARGALVNARENSHDQTSLMWAVAQGHDAVAKILVDHGADVKARTRTTKELVVREVSLARQSCPGPNPQAPCVEADLAPKGGFTPLLFAARQGSIASARLLISGGAGVDDPAADGNSPLVVAAHAGHTALVELFLAKGANPNSGGAGYTALHAAILRGDLAAVTQLLARGADPNARLVKGTPVRRSGQDLTFSRTILGATPLFLAAKYMEPKIMKALLAKGADPLLAADDGTTTLMAAAGIGWAGLEDRRGVTFSIGTAVPQDEDAVRETVLLLLERNVDVNAANKQGDTALHGAVSKGYDSVVQLLAEKGAKLNVRNKRGKTPLGLTAVNREGAVVGEAVQQSTEMVLRKLGATE